MVRRIFGKDVLGYGERLVVLVVEVEQLAEALFVLLEVIGVAHILLVGGSGF